MKIRIKSNFFLPGFEGRESIEFDRSSIKLGELLEALTTLAGRSNFEYVRPAASTVADDWEVKIDGRDFQERGGLDADLSDGSTVTINLRIFGGG